MENAAIVYGQLDYFTVIWYILWPFGNVVVFWYISPRLGIFFQDKSGNPGCKLPGTVVGTILKKENRRFSVRVLSRCKKVFSDYIHT
jgi:hypothetical protein